MKPEDRCPACGLLVLTLPAFQAHIRAVGQDEAHLQAIWSLIGIDYAQMRADERADERAEALERARERGWRLL